MWNFSFYLEITLFYDIFWLILYFNGFYSCKKTATFCDNYVWAFLETLIRCSLWCFIKERKTPPFFLLSVYSFYVTLFFSSLRRQLYTFSYGQLPEENDKIRFFSSMYFKGRVKVDDKAKRQRIKGDTQHRKYSFVNEQFGLWAIRSVFQYFNRTSFKVT